LIKAAISRLVSIFIVLQVSALNAASLEDISILTEDYPPYTYVDSTGEVEGMSVRMLEESYAQIDETLDKSRIKVQPWARAYRSALNGKNTLLFSTNRTAQREKLFQWAGPISNAKTVLLARVDRHIKIDGPQSLRQYVIGGIRDDVAMQLVAKELAGEGTLLSSPYNRSLLRMLSLGRIDLWAYSERAAKQLLSKNGFNPADYESVYTLQNSNIYFAFSKNTPSHLVTKLQLGIDRVKQCDQCLKRVFNEAQ